MPIYLGDNNITGGFTTEEKKQFNNSINLINEQLDDKVNKEVGKGLSTNDLTNELVTKINSSATEAFVTNAIANAQLGDKEVDLSGYATVDALNLKADLTHTHDQYLTKVPDEYITETELTAKKYLTSVPSTYALKTDIPTVPTKTSQLTNDSKFITSIPAEYITETELKAKGYLTSHQDISGLQTKTDNNLATTSKEVVGAINEVKSLNDTKLNKTDANKLNCVSIDNVSLKEYILTNFTGTEKTYYIIAKTTCTDLPKASNFFITVETPGMYTYKVTAKELNDSNGIYVCTYRTISSSWSAWEKVLITGDITTTISDSSTDTQVPSAKAVYDELQEVFQSVSNGKNLIASAITDKGVDTLADATFKQMADNIGMISGGSETIPTSYNKGTIDCGKIKDIILDISKTYFVTTAVKFTETNHTNRVANFFITNGVLNTIINPGEATSSCSLTGDKLTIRNTNSAYSIDYTVLQM